ncbi:MAG TPA: AAA domain-containing protein, partial [Puia sp.]|nr:AAA domain-containing protein [Puia sp.]
MEPNRIPFSAFLSSAQDKGDYSTDDIIAFVLPLFKKVLSLHEEGLVGPFEKEDALFVTNGIADIDESMAHAPDGVLPYAGGEPGSIYIAGYRCFEHDPGHHDPQTDIFCLGLVLASVALGLDLYAPDDLQRLAKLRVHPTQHYPRIHPTVGRLITEMTEPDRALRSQDLYDVIGRLEHYRDYDPEKQTDLSGIPGWLDRDLKEREAYILNRLCNRLFDTSRRNRLLYFKPNARFVNLTVSSIPMVLHTRSIRPELLFTWTPELSRQIVGGKEIVLNKYLRFDDHPYLPFSLDRVRVESQRDIQEYGFSQLKLVIAFLEWYNLKEDVQERIRSPLLLVPVSLKKNKKVKEDHYILKVLDSAAEVNPVLAGQLRELHGIRLPDFIDLEEMGPEQLYRLVKAQIEEANQGIVLRYSGIPRIDLLREEAARTVDKYQSKTNRLKRRETGIEPTEKTDATYEPAPGLERVKVTDEHAPEPRNPYDWDFDVCNMVLGNFHYKKMSLVRDYNLVIDRRLQHPTFDALFGNQPRTFPGVLFDGNRPDDWFHVVNADPTQTRAIQQSRAGYSLIIQGPPGTGKSQTITNLIADFVARGKSILFVCEKRAALDVVYHRLKQVGLEELCCYIHDSQGDKKEFIKNLKTTYEDFIQARMDLPALKERRETLVHHMNRQLDLIREFHDMGLSEEKDSGISVRQLMEQIIALRDELTDLSPSEEELLPGYGEWKAAGPVLSALESVMEEAGAGAVFSEHPFSRIREAIFVADHPHQALETALREALQAMSEVETLVARCKLETRHLQEPGRLKNLVQLAVLLYPLARTGNMALADPDTAESRALEKQIRLYRQQQDTQRLAIQNNIHWKHKLSEPDVDAALVICDRYERAFFGGLNGIYRRLKRHLRESYDLSAHAVAPSFHVLLQNLKAEYVAAAQVDETGRMLEDRFHLGPNIDTARLSIEMLQSRKGHPELVYLLHHADGPALVAALQALHQPLNRLETTVRGCFEEPVDAPLAAIRDELLNVQLNADGLGDWLPALRAFSRLSPAIKTTLRRLPLRMKQVEAAIVRRSLQQLYQSHRVYAGIDGAALGLAVQRLGEDYASLQEINAQLIRAFVRQRFLHQVELSNRAAGQLTEEQKKFKRAYSEGRKILENEFGKSMRFKSIRELSEKESGMVLKGLKPVWLMSPYSVSDSLPLEGDHFDVVIFDEASQITLEEGVPALYRSQQTIIVGDEKQMPPTDFFGSRTDDPEDLDKPDAPEEDDRLTIDADSLLAQGARKLESTLLRWHYRSHSETLISYSNHAFYE